MVTGKRFTKEEIEKLKELFQRYMEDKEFTLKDIAGQLKRTPTGIGKQLKRLFGEQYLKTAKEKQSVQKRKVSDEQVRKLFIEYKQGKTMKELADSVGMKAPPLSVRMRKIIGVEYKITVREKIKDKKKIQKVSDEKLKEIFEKTRHFELVDMLGNLRKENNLPYFSS